MRSYQPDDRWKYFTRPNIGAVKAESDAKLSKRDQGYGHPFLKKEYVRNFCSVEE